jgi:prepilin-type N-terminal cleavage/methylation domain-containing protein
MLGILFGVTRNSNLEKKGFTLIELVVVIVIIGILASVALPMFNNVVERSRTAEALANLKTVFESQKRRAVEFGSFATAFPSLDINLTNPGKYYTFVLGTPTYNGGGSNEDMARAVKVSAPIYTICITETGNFTCSDSSIILPQ